MSQHPVSNRADNVFAAAVVALAAPLWLALAVAALVDHHS